MRRSVHIEVRTRFAKPIGVVDHTRRTWVCGHDMSNQSSTANLGRQHSANLRPVTIEQHPGISNMAKDEGLGPPMVKSATRILRIFEVFAESKRPMRISELARELNIPQSSASVLVRTLIQRGYMDFSPPGRAVLPTLRLTLLGSWLDDQFSSEGGLHDMLGEIAERCGDTVILGAEMGIQVQYIHVVPGAHPLRYDIKRGTLRYLADANAGRVLLSLKSDEEIERTTVRINAERPEGRVDRRKLRDEIAKIRRDGYSFGENLVIPGASVIAMQLRFQRFHRPLAVGIAGATERLRKNLRPNLALLTNVMQKYSPDAY